MNREPTILEATLMSVGTVTIILLFAFTVMGTVKNGSKLDRICRLEQIKEACSE